MSNGGPPGVRCASYTRLLIGMLALLALFASLPSGHRASGQQTADIALSPGWNLVSLSLVPADSAPATVLASITGQYNSAWAYQPGQVSPWLSYDPNIPPLLNTLTAIDVSMGFWLNMKEAGTLAVSGSEPASTQIAISPGWNFIGYPSSQTRDVPDVLAGLSYNSAWAYDPGQASPWQSYDPNVPPFLNTLQQFTPNRGYAVNASAAGVLTIAGAAATSEELIAAALAAGDITYEESLLERAYALFDDPRLQDEFRSPIMDWEAGAELFNEVDENEGQLSQQLLADLAPFRARPNDPISIFNNPPAGTGLAAPGPAFAWQSDVIPGTSARVWALGAPGVHQQYIEPISTVWSALLGIFVYPNPDEPGNPNLNINPDGAIDFYFVDPGIDPRFAECEANPNQPACLEASDYGLARRAPKRVGNTSSGYLIVNAKKGGDNQLDTIAHELTHVSQYSYDTGEASWLYESTATWAAYRVMKTLGKTPDYAYAQARNLYEHLDKPLNRETKGDNDKYGSWLFFLHASMERGDVIVSDIWEKAKTPGAQGIQAVDQAFPLDDNFDDFSVRNWNEKPPLLTAYKDAPDNTFPQDLHPDLDRERTFEGEGEDTLNLPVRNLSAVYYRYVFEAPVRHIIFENNLVNTEGAHVWVLKKIGGDWKPPEDMAGAPVQTWCRDSATFQEDLSELVVIVSNSKITGDLPTPTHNAPRVIADLIGCYALDGWAETTLKVVDDNQDMTYTSGRVNLRFEPRAIQDEPGNVQYDLSAQSQGVHWVASGTVGGCPAEGETTVLFPGVPYTPFESAAGYLNVVGPGDFHSVLISAFDPEARVTVTCPGDPPTVTEVGFDAGYLLYILMAPNGHNPGQLILEGEQFFVFGNSTYHFKWHLAPVGGPPA